MTDANDREGARSPDDSGHSATGYSVSGADTTGQAIRKPAQERREQLISCAVDSYLELGLGRAGHGDVAKRAGVSTGTVFNYFPTRPDLTRAVLAHVRARTLAVFDLVGEASGSVEADVNRIRDVLLATSATDPNVRKLLLSWGNSFAPDLREGYLDLQGEILQRVRHYVRPGPRNAVDARIVLGAGLMFMQMIFDGTDEAAMAAFAGRVGELLAGA